MKLDKRTIAILGASLLTAALVAVIIYFAGQSCQGRHAGTQVVAFLRGQLGEVYALRPNGHHLRQDGHRSLRPRHDVELR